MPIIPVSIVGAEETYPMLADVKPVAGSPVPLLANPDTATALTVHDGQLVRRTLPSGSRAVAGAQARGPGSQARRGEARDAEVGGCNAGAGTQGSRCEARPCSAEAGSGRACSQRASRCRTSRTAPRRSASG